MIRKFWSLVSSRRVRVSFGIVFAFVAFSWLNKGLPDPDVLQAGAVLLLGWLVSNSVRPETGSLGESRRLIAMLLGQAAILVCAKLGFNAVPTELLTELALIASALLVGEGLKRHEIKPSDAEDAPPVPATP